MKNKLPDMMCLDISLSSMSKKEYEEVKPRIADSKTKPMPLLSWDIFMYGFKERMAETIRKVELKGVLSLAEKFKWKNDLNTTFSENDYEALIITDINQNIIWVNDGFSAMTGYSETYALNKTPKFLQGEKTSMQTKKTIKENISQDKPFEGVIINYKKDKTTYKCEVKIIPLYSDKTTHYIAFEKKVG